MGAVYHAVYTCDRCGREAVLDGIKEAPRTYHFLLPQGWRELSPFDFLSSGDARILLACEVCISEIATFIGKRKESDAHS